MATYDRFAPFTGCPVLARFLRVAVSKLTPSSWLITGSLRV